MAIPEDRLSTDPVIGDLYPPDDIGGGYTEDREKGPKGLNDTSEGTRYQNWYMLWEPSTGDFVVTPEDVGVPSAVHNAALVTQCSFCFDNNAHVTIAYMADGLPYLWWYDTEIAGYTVTQLNTGAWFPMLTLDDKRPRQTAANDMMLYYTKQQPDLTWNLYKLEQRERFLTEQLMQEDVFPIMYKLGMNNGFRVQLVLRVSQ